MQQLEDSIIVGTLQCSRVYTSKSQILSWVLFYWKWIFHIIYSDYGSPPPASPRCSPLFHQENPHSL